MSKLSFEDKVRYESKAGLALSLMIPFKYLVDNFK